MTVRWLDKQADRIRRHLGLSRYHPRRRWITYCPMCGRKLKGIGGELMGGGKPYDVFKCPIHGYPRSPMGTLRLGRPKQSA